MAKQGMKRPEISRSKEKNAQPPVPEIQGKAKRGHEHARPVIAGTHAPSLKVYHSKPHSEKPISDAYPVLDTDLARDNVENDIPFADLNDL